MDNIPVKNGMWMGIVGISLTIFFYFTSIMAMISFGSLITFFFTLYFMRKAVKDTKLVNNGFASYRQAFHAAWLTYILGTVIITVFNYVLTNFIDPSILIQAKEIQISALDQVNTLLKISESDMEKLTESIENTNPYGLSSIAYGLPFSFIIPGALISSIMAMIMKREDPIKLT